MSALAGLLSITDAERAYVQNIGQGLVFDAVNELLRSYNEEVDQQIATFVERKTEKFAMRYLLPGGGKLQRMGQQGAAGTMKRHGYYDVGFPLRQWGAEIGGNRVDMAYMTVAELSAHLDTIIIQDLNTMRWRILTSIFEDTNLTFTDAINGAVTVTRLANTDGSLYPPVVGSETEADDDHYIDAAYNVAGIAAATNPVVTLVAEIAEHFGGTGSSGRNFVYFHGADQTVYLAAIAGYVPIADQYITPANTAATTVGGGWPNVPGRVHGRGWGAWLVEWDGWIPDEYGLCILTDVPAPLLMRVDPADVGLGDGGLQLVAEDKQHPMQRASYERRYGFGCGNRLSAAVMEINAGGGTYTPPGAYDE